jgi:hypothetical protein
VSQQKAALEIFKKFLTRLAAAEVFTSYTKPEMTKSKDEIVFSAEGVDEQSKDDTWTVRVTFKKGTGNLFYSREYHDGGYQTQKEGVRAKGDESLAVLFTKLLNRIKKNQ